MSTVYVYTYDWRAIEEYGNGVLSRNYTYGDWIDEILTMDRAAEGDHFYYHDDALGSIIAVSNNAGVPVERYSYDAYGEPSFFDGDGNSINQFTIGNSYLFTGRNYDSETGLYYYRTRYLHPVIGRFITRDTIGIWGDTLSLGNGYTYAGNNPRSKVDPFGLNAARREELERKLSELLHQMSQAWNEVKYLTGDIIVETGKLTEFGVEITVLYGMEATAGTALTVAENALRIAKLLNRGVEAAQEIYNAIEATYDTIHEDLEKHLSEYKEISEKIQQLEQERDGFEKLYYKLEAEYNKVLKELQNLNEEEEPPPPSCI
jgi:RHS repeat-associated protein